MSGDTWQAMCQNEARRKSEAKATLLEVERMSLMLNIGNVKPEKNAIFMKNGKTVICRCSTG